MSILSFIVLLFSTWALLATPVGGFMFHSLTAKHKCSMPMSTNGVDASASGEESLPDQPYISSMLWEDNSQWEDFVKALSERDPGADPLWEQVRMEALTSLSPEPEAGPQLYQTILSQPSLVDAIVTVIAVELETELVMATELKNLFLQMLTPEDYDLIARDVVAASTRNADIGNALTAILFHTGLHALVCYRVGHRLWQAERKGLAYYLQSAVSRHYSADIHPACRMGGGIYLSTTVGVVIGETVVMGDDVTILPGVTLGGTGKERGDRHPKVHTGASLLDGAKVLGNIIIGEGSVVSYKSIVLKPVPPLAVVSGVPAKVVKYRSLEEEDFDDDISNHLGLKYREKWRNLLPVSTDHK